MDMIGCLKVSLADTTKLSIWLGGETASICLLILRRSYSMFLNMLTSETMSLRMLSTCTASPLSSTDSRLRKCSPTLLNGARCACWNAKRRSWRPATLASTFLSATRSQLATTQPWMIISVPINCLFFLGWSRSRRVLEHIFSYDLFLPVLSGAKIFLEMLLICFLDSFPLFVRFF